MAKMELGGDGSLLADRHCSINIESSQSTAVDSGSTQLERDDYSFQTESSPLVARKVREIHDEKSIMRERLSYFFMSTLDKYILAQKYPWKMLLQITIIVICTTQMTVFGWNRMEYVKVNEDMTAFLKRIVLKDWDPAQEENDESIYAVYTAPQMINHVDFVVEQYLRIRELSAESYGYDSIDGEMVPFRFCLQHYPGKVSSGNYIEGMDGSLKKTCLLLPPKGGQDKPEGSFLNQSFSDSNFVLNFGTLFNAELTFYLKSIIIIRSESGRGFPECHRVELKITYDNKDNAGPVFIRMSVHSQIIACHLKSTPRFQENFCRNIIRQSLNLFLILFCLASTVLCLRSLYKGCRLCQETRRFFRHFYGKDIPLWERLDFIDFWYAVIVVGDAMLICGSVLNSQLEGRQLGLHIPCSMLLGVGHLLVLIGTLRYFKFFPRYNVLIVTLKKAVPNVLRFLLCILVLFAGYCLCGWVVLSPYHSKFATLSSTAECLFAIMNGDDVFGAFNALATTVQPLVWWFSRVYLLSFLFVFMYLAGSLMISVIMDAFESVKYVYQNGESPSTMVEKFVAKDGEYSPIASSDIESDVHSKPKRYIQKLMMWLK